MIREISKVRNIPKHFLPKVHIDIIVVLHLSFETFVNLGEFLLCREEIILFNVDDGRKFGRLHCGGSFEVGHNRNFSEVIAYSQCGDQFGSQMG
jgi:hypothetical protein